MKRKNITYISVLVSIAVSFASLLGSCSDKDMVKTDNGYAFKRCTKHDSAPKASKGDVLFGCMKILLNDKTVISNSYGSPMRLFTVGKPDLGSIDEFLATLHVGDSAYMIIPADSLQPLVSQREFRPDDKLHVYLTVTQLISQRELSENEKENKRMQQKEEALLTDFVLEHYDRANKTESGLFFMMIYDAKGKKPEFGDRVYVNYSVSDTSGNMIETNVEEYAKKGDIYHAEKLYKPFDYIYGDDAMIAGWTEGLSYMSQGSRAKLIVPSKLAYGTEGFGRIKPNTPLVFDMTLVKVEKNQQ